MDNTASLGKSTSSERMLRFRTGIDRMLDRRWVRILFLVISGGVTGACMTFSSFPLMLAEWISLIPACLVIFRLADDLAKKRSGRIRFRTVFRLWGCGFLFFMSEYLVVYHWFVSMYPLEFTGISKAGAAAVVLLGWVGLSILGSLACGVVFALAVSVCSGKLCTLHPILRMIAPAIIYPLFEIFETFFWTGVPWNRLGLGQLASATLPPLTLLSSSLFGPYFTTFLIVFTSASIAHGLFFGKLKKRSLLAASVFTANLIIGLAVFLFSPAGGNFRAAAVQGNFTSASKWSASLSDTLDRYERLTEEAARQGAEAVVWPETALTVTLVPGSQTDRLLSSAAKENGLLLSVGCFEEGETGSKNVIRCYYPDGTAAGDSYSKRHLVPFGEYVPVRDLIETLIPPLTEISMLSSDLEAGSGTAILELGETRIGWLICFDSIYERLCRDTARDGAQVVFMSTNDSWFGTSRALYMHLAQARLRAIENGIPVVRSANTGISAVIDRFGRISAVSEPDTEAVVCAEVELPSGRTLYSVTGEVFIFLSLAFVLATAAFEIVCFLKEKRR